MGKVVQFGKIVRVDKYYNEDNRKVIQLYDVENEREMVGSYVDGQLMNIYVLDTLLYCLENGYRVIVNNQWKKDE